MRISSTAILLVLLATACSGQRRAAPPPTQTARAPTRAAQPAFRGGNAIRRSDVPYNQLLAEARATGKPAVLFFWTSW